MKAPRELATTSPATEITREDLAALAAVHRRESAHFNRWGSAAFIMGLTLGVGLLTLRSSLGWAEGLDPVFFFGGWAVGLAGAMPFYLRQRRVRSRLSLSCPQCAALLLDSGSLQQDLPLADLIVATGVCPRCGTALIASGNTESREA